MKELTLETEQALDLYCVVDKIIGSHRRVGDRAIVTKELSPRDMAALHDVWVRLRVSGVTSLKQAMIDLGKRRAT